MFFKMKRGVTTIKSAESVESALHTSPSLNEISSVTKPRTIVVDEVEGRVWGEGRKRKMMKETKTKKVSHAQLECSRLRAIVIVFATES